MSEDTKNEQPPFKGGPEPMKFGRKLGEAQIPLRDWMAGMALAGASHSWINGDNEMGYGPDNLAADCYSIADAMLAEREKGGVR